MCYEDDRYSNQPSSTEFTNEFTPATLQQAIEKEYICDVAFFLQAQNSTTVYRSMQLLGEFLKVGNYSEI